MLSETITVKKSCRQFVFMKQWPANNSSVPYGLGKTGCPLCPGILSVLRIASWCARDESKNVQSTEVSPTHYFYPLSHDWLSEIRAICSLNFSYVYRKTLPHELINTYPDCKILTVYHSTFPLSTFPSESLGSPCQDPAGFCFNRLDKAHFLTCAFGKGYSLNL